MSFHKDLTLGDIHIAHQWSYADSTARAAATGFVATDVGKLALQEDDNSLWILTATTPTWVAVDSTTLDGAYDNGNTIDYTLGVPVVFDCTGVTPSPAYLIQMLSNAGTGMAYFHSNGKIEFNTGQSASGDFVWYSQNYTNAIVADSSADSVTFDANVYLLERAAAAADVAGDGQIWVKNDTPNTLYFTDDAGTDTKLTKTRTAYVFAKGGTIGTTTLLNNGLDTVPIPYAGTITRIEGFVGTWTLDLGLTADTLNVNVTYGPYGGTSTSGVATNMGAAGTFGGDKTLTVSQGDILKVATTVTPAGGPDTIANLTIVVVIEH